jgi:hypothetical protein
MNNIENGMLLRSGRVLGNAIEQGKQMMTGLGINPALDHDMRFTNLDAWGKFHTEQYGKEGLRKLNKLFGSLVTVVVLFLFAYYGAFGESIATTAELYYDVYAKSVRNREGNPLLAGAMIPWNVMYELGDSKSIIAYLLYYSHAIALMAQIGFLGAVCKKIHQVVSENITYLTEGQTISDRPIGNEGVRLFTMISQAPPFKHLVLRARGGRFIARGVRENAKFGKRRANINKLAAMFNKFGMATVCPPGFAPNKKYRAKRGQRQCKKIRPKKITKKELQDIALANDVSIYKRRRDDMGFTKEPLSIKALKNRLTKMRVSYVKV